MTIKTHYVIKSRADEGYMDGRFRPNREHIFQGTTGVVWWNMQQDSSDWAGNDHTVWAFDSRDDAASFAQWASLRWPGYDFVVLAATEGYRAVPGPIKKVSVSEKGILPA